MRIGFNATCFDERPSGANQRFKYIYGALIRSNPDVEFLVYEPSDVAVARWFGDAPNVVARPTPVPSIGRLPRLRAGFGFWGPTLKADRLDLFEVFHLPLVKAPDCPTVLTIHDLRPMLPDQPRASRMLASVVTRHAFANADRVITVSDTMKDAILAFRPGTPVSTIYNGVPIDAFRTPADAGTSVAPYRPDDFIVTVGHLEPRKNIAMLVEAMALLRDRGLRVPLVIAGNDIGERSRIEAQIARLGLGDTVAIVSNASDEQIRGLYAAARLAVFPSRYEGFGIPLIEAMASGRALVTSDIPVFQEITRGKAGVFPTDDPVKAADAIAAAWSDAAWRAEMVAFGNQRVNDFRFDTLAAQVAAIHRALT